MALFANAVQLVTPSLFTAEEGGFHPPSLDEFFPEALFFEGTIFEINRIMLIRIIMVIVLLVLFWLGTRRMKVIPTRAQSLTEMALDFVRVSIGEELLGKKDAKRFMPILMTMFFLILAFNITGIIPFMNIAASSVVGFPIVLAIVSYVMFIYAGVKKSPGKFFKNSLFPAGVPWPLYILVTPIEFFSTFIMRPVTLALRLLMNMLVGHLLLVLFFAATQFFLFDSDGIFKLFGIGTFAFGFAFTLFEILVAVLQAYVFTLLTAVYIQLALAEEH
ncbi:ATP synthase F0 subcomplex A subunit [Leucobacter luti]|uniref:ATP synthase subunit a n=2 Tax=Leucobacter luti TaxID=340320 RepID=A0A4R6RYD3_9MICO|nr:F0F1 ATP synthase subunit A [Leucobacter luti]QYM77454.1 F0F1 ATP synthase subunit A [Leucobacter luti]TDP91597.1 ATP synthase F0 subcomplex A subunit [Leucobacter luti]